jgi:hypothetical protein
MTAKALKNQGETVRERASGGRESVEEWADWYFNFGARVKRPKKGF